MNIPIWSHGGIPAGAADWDVMSTRNPSISDNRSGFLDERIEAA
jgi:hypothetical protein